MAVGDEGQEFFGIVQEEVGVGSGQVDYTYFAAQLAAFFSMCY
jgi:hypothetical protein